MPLKVVNTVYAMLTRQREKGTKSEPRHPRYAGITGHRRLRGPLAFRRGVARPRNPAITTRDGELYARWNAGERHLATLAKDYGITAQRVGQVIAAKDGQVYTAWRTGKYTLADLAGLYDLTPEDVTRILVARHPEQEDEKTGRAIMRSRLELLTIAVQEVIENPGFKITAVGRVLGAKIEALKVQLNVYKNLAVLNGDEKPQRSVVRHDIAQQEADAHLAAIRAKIEADNRELEALRRRVSVVPGEVLAELPPGGG